VDLCVVCSHDEAVILKFLWRWIGGRGGGAPGGAVGGGTVLQAERSRLRFPGSTWPVIETEYYKYLLGGKGGRCVGLTTLPTFVCRLSCNFGASTSWKPQGQCSRDSFTFMAVNVKVTDLWL